MLIVLSPAKNLDYDRALPSDKHSQPDMLEQSQTLIHDLRKLAPHQVSALMKISDKLGTLNHDRFQQWQPPFNPNNARQALFAFNGDVYAGLDAYSFDDNDLDFAQQHLRILSGLYGLLKPLDLMQAYRLEMGTRFANAAGKDLYQFWGTQITDALNTQLKQIKSTALINLASNEYFKAVHPQQLSFSRNLKSATCQRTAHPKVLVRSLFVRIAGNHSTRALYRTNSRRSSPPLLLYR